MEQPNTQGKAAASETAAEAHQTGAVPAAGTAVPSADCEANSDAAPVTGLTSEEVAQRVAQGQVNVDAGVKTRSIKQICYQNILTLFNFVNAVLCCFVLYTGSLKNALFMIVIICNTAIGIVQEIRSKKTTDALSIIVASKADVVRDGTHVSIPLDQIVLGDVVGLGRGAQIPADAQVVSGACSVNESLLTGESKLVKKQVGDTLMSGSFVDSGTVYAQVQHVGADNYAARITAEAKAHKAINSEIMNTLNGIIKFVSILIFPLGIALFCREHFSAAHTPVNDAILSTVAALVGMIPEGLILLTSTVLAVAVIRLAQSKVLVQQLYCIETLARVDTLCLDKTGTITTGAMEVASVQPLADADAAEVNRAFASLAASDSDPNDTAKAIVSHYKDAADVLAPTHVVAFSSVRKWSGASFSDGTSYVMGAAQFVMGDAYGSIEGQVSQLSQQARVLVLARVRGFSEDDAFTGAPVALGFIAITDQIRSTAAQTIGYFKEQGVDLKVISGDDPRTVSHIASQVGVPGAEEYVDATTLDDDAAIADAIGRYHVFGRVKPEQKKAFVVALQARGHTVAMTGDGVNDTLALKQADCSVAMAAGSSAARNVAHLVLVDNDFASMPKVVGEGRRSINNLERSASLFLVKTLLSLVLAVFFVILPWQYPFQPIQMTLISAFTIGIPSFVLALEPNHDRIRGTFLENVVVKSIPGSIAGIVAVLAVNIVGYTQLHLDYQQVSTMCVLLLAWVGMNLIFRVSLPFTPIRAALLVFVVVGTVLGATLFPGLFAIAPFTDTMWQILAGTAVGAAAVFHVCYSLLGNWHAARQARLV